MKKLFASCIYQTFDAQISRKKKQSGFAFRNVKYFWCETQEEANQKYERLYNVFIDKVVTGWGEIVHSKNFDLMMYECAYSNIKCEVVDYPVYETISIDTLKENIGADDFAEWWFSHNKQ